MLTKRGLIALTLTQIFLLSVVINTLPPKVSAAPSDPNTEPPVPGFSEHDTGEESGSDSFNATDYPMLEFVPGEVLVKLRWNPKFRIVNGAWTVGVQSIDALIKKFKVSWITRIAPANARLSNVFKLEVPKDLDVLYMAKQFETIEDFVEYAEPNGVYRTFVVPNDANYTQQWAHQIIESEDAWNIATGDSVVIAIVDSGVDYNHPDLAANIWINADEIPDNDIDDDQNGFIDDVRGWDFVEAPPPVYAGEDGTEPDNDPMDFLGHGTMCAGVAAGIGNNEIGIAGVTWNSKIMAVRSGFAVEGGGVLLFDHSAAGMCYAVDNGADIISMSFGGTYRSKVVYDAVKHAYDNGVLLFGAAGNDQQRIKGFPAAYEEVIAVTATDQYDSPAYFTNFGSWVDVAAPGVDILSTTSPNSSIGPYKFEYPYDYASGTSAAAPHVAGVAALILSQFPTMTRDQVTVQLLRTTVDLPPEGFDIYYGYGRINASGAVNLAPTENDLLVLNWKLPFVSAPEDEETAAFYPSGGSLLGSTQYVSGSLTDLQSNNGVYMTLRSYQSATAQESLFAHQETTTIGGSTYYLQKLVSADAAGTSLSASMASTGRQLLGKFVYPLTGVTSIPASTWTMYYRAWRDAVPSIAFDTVSSGNNGGGSASVSWSHTTGSGSNRIMIVGVSIRTTSVSVSSITYGVQSLTFIRADVHSSATICSELWYLIAPASGTATVTVTLSGTSKATGGSCTYTGVAQTSPLDVMGGGTGTSSSPSQSVTVTTSDSWLLGHLAISGTATISSEGSGQTLRWDQVTTGGGASTRNRGHCSDKGPVGIGSQSVSWTLSASANWAVSMVAIKPAPAINHEDVDILIRQSDGAIRTSIATNVANSADLITTPTTLSGTYSWAAYTVVDQNDCLEIDYYVDVTAAKSGTAAYLRIDDTSLALADETRADIYLPSQFTVEAEFTGSSNTEDWTQLVWTIDSRFTAENVTATFQLFNYTANVYSTSGEGYITDTIGTTDVTKTQTVTINPKHFRNATGSWKLKVKGVKSTSSKFDWQGDLIKYEVIWPLCFVETTVLNFGTESVSEINLKLLVNGVEKDSERISVLQSGESAKVRCSWTPEAEGKFNFTTYVEPKNELSNVTANNAQSAYAWVRYGKAVTVPEDFSSIQEAIEVANLEIYGGEATIHVSNGTYYEYDLLIQGTLTSLTLAGENSQNTIISGDPSYSGVWVNVDNVTVEGFTIEGFSVGVVVWSGNSTVVGNNLTNNRYGAHVTRYYNNTVRDNIVSGNSQYGIRVALSSGDAIINNTLSSNGYGLFLSSANKTLISNNTFTDNNYGIWLAGSSDNVFTNNTLMGNTYGFGIDGYTLSNFLQDIDTTNTVEGRLIYYLINQSNIIINPSTFPNAGYIALVNSTGVTVRDLDLSKNGQGIMFAWTKESTIQNANVSNNRYGISFFNCSNTFITSNAVTDNYYGVYTSKSINNTISHNILQNDYYSIEVSVSSDNDIRNNTVADTYRGIGVYSSNNDILEDNTITNGTYGVYLYTCDNSVLTNTVANSTYGIYLYSCENSVLTNNNMTNNTYNFFVYGLALTEYIHNINTSNTINGKPIYYLVNQENLVIDPLTHPNIGYLGLVNSINITVKDILLLAKNGQGILCANLTYSYIQNVNASNNYYGIHLFNSNATFFSGNTLLGNVNGFRLANSYNNTIGVGNLIKNTSREGIYSDSSDNNTISGNTITEIDRDGIYLKGSDNNTISGNAVSKCGRVGYYNGVVLSSSGNNTIDSNAISSNDYGVKLDADGNNTIKSNSITYNTYGIYLWHCDLGNFIRFNMIANNTGEGIRLVASSNSVIYHNNFMGNKRHVYNSASYNSWDSEAEGNYWTGYTGQDLDGDGIGDTAYVIDASNRDRYPLMKKWGIYALNLHVKDWDLIDNIQNAYVYVDLDYRIAGTSGWANWTAVSDRNVYVKVRWYDVWVNGTFRVVVDSNKTIDIQCKIYDIVVTAVETVQGAVLQNVNVTVYSALGSMIRTGITDSNGKVNLTNVPNSTLTFTCYEGASPQIIANVNRTITTENQAETIICDQNYVSTSQEWNIITENSIFSLSLVPLPVIGLSEYLGINSKCLKERVKKIRSKQNKSKERKEVKNNESFKG